MESAARGFPLAPNESIQLISLSSRTSSPPCPIPFFALAAFFDAHAIARATETWAEETPGVPARLSNTVLQAQEVKIWNSTLTLDVEFKRRLPAGGLG